MKSRKNIWPIFLLLSISSYTNQGTTVVSMKSLLEKVNEIRTNPQAQASIIQTKILDKINENGVHTEWRLKYNEGKVAVQEAIDYLAAKEPVGAVTLDQGLSRSAYEHSYYQIEVIKQMTHSGPDGQGLGDRVKKYNDWKTGGIFENIVGSSSIWNTAEMVCFAWIIDDGVPTRGHRKNFFAESATKMGLGIYNHNEGKNDRITQVFVTDGVSDCTKCDTFTDTQNNEMCWTSFKAGNDVCDTGDANSIKDEQKNEEEQQSKEKTKRVINYTCKSCCCVCSSVCIFLLVLKFKSLLGC